MQMIRLTRLLAVCASTLLLSACLLTPGKFDSTLDIRADRSFTFTYRGEVIATDMNSADSLSAPSSDNSIEVPSDAPEIDGQTSAYMQPIAAAKGGAKKAPAPSGGMSKAEKPDQTAKMQAIAAALSKEKGFRSVLYKGDNHFTIDYAISGTLNHAFIWPFNSDAEAIIPFIAIELRGNDRVRVKAPGYANNSKESGAMGGMGGMGGGSGNAAAKELDGRFTLTTNGEIVSHNQEEGPATVATGKQLFWKVDPLTSDAPTAVIRFPAK